MNQHKHIDFLIAKLEDGTINEEEYQTLIAWYNSFDDSKVVLYSQGADSPELLKARMRQKLTDAIHRGNTRRDTSVKIKKWLPHMAAAVLILVAASAWLLQDKITDFSDLRVSQSAHVQDVLPGGNRAMLTLADGQIIDLKEEEGGIFMGDKLSYADGSSVFTPEEEKENPYYVLSTPRGGTYRVSLPDGTIVWLNAESSLRYPSRFSENERVVEISGEAYFSVAQDKSKPFKVVNAAQTVSVLGTAFNITAYEDEKEIKTTLVEGSVRVEPSANRLAATILQPGQQANLNNGVIGVQNVNTAPYIAWKDGVFYFEDTPFDVMMRQIARWYNVDVFYENEIPKESFSGKLRRSVTLAGVLEMLRTSDIQVELKENTVVVN